MHVALYTETHREFRKVLIDRELSMQEVFQKFSELAASGDKRVSKILDELVNEKREGSSKRTSNVIDIRNIDNIYQIIGDSTSSNEEEDD